METAKKKWNEKEAEEAELKLEISELQKALNEAAEHIQEFNVAIEKRVAEIEKLTAQLAESRAAVDAAKAAVKAQKESLMANSKEIASLNAKIDKTHKHNQAQELEIKKLKNDIEKVSATCFIIILCIRTFKRAQRVFSYQLFMVINLVVLISLILASSRSYLECRLSTVSC